MGITGRRLVAVPDADAEDEPDEDVISNPGTCFEYEAHR